MSMGFQNKAVPADMIRQYWFEVKFCVLERERE